MAPDTTRKAVNLAAADARRAIEALQEQSISLQRELAEARAEIDSLKSRASLTPLADPSVRGVLVPCADDDPHLSIVVDDVTGRKCVGKLRPASEFGVPAKPKAEVRFEANEGVPSLERVQLAINTLGYYGQFQQGQDGWAALCILRAHLAALKSTPAEPAQKLVPLPEGARVFVPADESGDFAVVDSGFPVSPIVGRFNEPKAHYGVPAERAWDQTELHRAQCEAIGLRAEVERQCERIASLTSAAETAEAEVARLEIVGHEGAARCERYKSEAERLRKAIETHKSRNIDEAEWKPEPWDCELWSALTPSPAARTPQQVERDRGLRDKYQAAKPSLEELLATGDYEPSSAPAAESEAERLRERVRELEAAAELRRQTNEALNAEAERLRKAIEMLAGECDRLADSLRQPETTKRICAAFAKTVADDLRAALTPPTAATGEAECPCDIERGCAKGDGVRVEGKCTLELKGRSVAPPSAPAAESEKPYGIVEQMDNGEGTVYGRRVTVKRRDEPAAESEGGDGWQSHEIHFDAQEMAALESLAEEYDNTSWPDAIVKCKAERDSLSARLAACEEEIKTLKAQLRSAYE